MAGIFVDRAAEQNLSIIAVDEDTDRVEAVRARLLLLAITIIFKGSTYISKRSVGYKGTPILLWISFRPWCYCDIVL